MEFVIAPFMIIAWFFRQWPIGTIVVFVLSAVLTMLTNCSATEPVMKIVGVDTPTMVKIIDSNVTWENEQWRGDYRVGVFEIHNTTGKFMERLIFKCDDSYFFDGTGMMPYEKSVRKYNIPSRIIDADDCTIDFRLGKPMYKDNFRNWEDRIS
jgi:hypothetical protein